MTANTPAGAPTTLSTASLVRRYAHAFTDRYGAAHGATSPLGVWLLLALLAPAAEGDARAELEQVLGTTAEDAARRAGALLADPHPAVRAAVAAWAADGQLVDAHAHWAAGLPAQVQTGPIPSQDAADRWAAHHTDGLIGTFPLEVRPETLVLLASALAARVPWEQELAVVDAAVLGGVFGAQVSRALASDDADQFLVQTAAAGLVAAHAPRSRAGVRVLSVIAAETVTPAAVHRAALEVAALLTGQESPARRVSLFDLPLEDGHAWTVTEQVVERMGRLTGPQERVASVLPAWSATRNVDVLDAPGMGPAVATLDSFAPAGTDLVFEAKQSTLAEYTASGFTAASVTTISMRAGAMPQFCEVLERTATVRYNRPHAVVAVAGPGDGPWSGLPLFSAWVGHATDVTD